MQQVELKISKSEKYVPKSNLKLKFSLIWKNSGIFITFTTIMILLSTFVPNFFSFSNLINVSRQASIDLFPAIGMTFVILCGEIDLSIGAIFSLSGTLTAGLLSNNYNVAFSVLIGLLVGGIAGLINGLLVTKARVASFIATLGVMTICRGMALLYTGGYPISGFPKTFLSLGRNYLWAIPLPTIYAFVLIIISISVLKQTRFGRYIYAAGGNSEAAWVSGIDVDMVKMSAFVINGILAAFSGIVLISRLNSAHALGGSGLELNAIAAVVLGGTSLAGGYGNIIGSVIGVLIMASISNGLNLAGVEAAWQDITVGIVIVIALLLNSFRK